MDQFQRSQTDVHPFVLEADKPQQLIGQFNAVKVLAGGYHSFYIFQDDPGSSVGSSDLLKARRLDRNGKLLVGPWKDPYIVAVQQSPKAGVPTLKLLTYSGAVGFVEQDDTDGMLTESVGWLTATTVSAGAAQLIGTTGNSSNMATADGNQEIHSRGFWSGFVKSDKAFHVECRVIDTLSGSYPLCAAESRDMGGNTHTLMLDLAFWDVSWQKSIGTYQGVTLPVRLPVAHGTKCTLYYQELSGLDAVVQAQVAIKSR